MGLGIYFKWWPLDIAKTISVVVGKNGRENSIGIGYVDPLTLL